MTEKDLRIDNYIASFPPETQSVLRKIRQIIHEGVPSATETIKYGIPSYVLKGNLIHFAGYKQFVSIYPAPHDPEMRGQLAPYLKGRGTLQFPLSTDLPVDLIRKIVAARVAEDQS